MVMAPSRTAALVLQVRVKVVSSGTTAMKEREPDTPTLASAVLGPISTAVLGMTNTSYGAGMGTSGLVGPLQAFDAMAGTHSGWTILLLVVVFYFLVPAALTLAFDALMRRIGWVRAGDMKLQKL